MNITQAKREIEKLQERVTTLESALPLIEQIVPLLCERIDKTLDATIRALLVRLDECKVISYTEPDSIDRIKEELGL